MLRRVDLQDLELSRAYFHFDQISNLGRIEKDNLTSKQADCSALLKETRRIYFSTGVSGILKFHDVYLKWRMNEIFGKKAIENKYDDNLKKTKIYEWNRTFITKEYKKDDYRKNIVFTKYYHDMLEYCYMVLNVSNGCDYNRLEYDEIKTKINHDEDSTDYLIMKEIYGEYSNFDSKIIDSWNMSTFRGRYVATKDIRVVTLDNKDANVIDILKYVYDNYKDTEYDLLDDFMLWLKTNEGK